MSKHDGKHEDYNKPKQPRYKTGGDGGRTQSHTNQNLNALLTTR